MRTRAWWVAAASVAVVGLPLVPGAPAAGAAGAVTVSDGAAFLTAFADPTTTVIALDADVTLTAVAERPAGSVPLEVDGAGFVLTGDHAGFGLASATSNSLTLHDATLTGFRNSAVSWDSGSVEVETVTFDGNRGTNGAAIDAESAALVVRGSTFTGNVAENNGGAIRNPSAPTLASITGSSFEANSAATGGAVLLSSAVIARSTFADNDATFDGGAIRGSSLSLDQVTVSGNVAGRLGGGIHAEALLVNDSTVANNRADLHGGGMLVEDLRVVNSTIDSNLAGQQGGGIFGRTVSLTFATVTRNDAEEGANLWDGEGSSWFSAPDVTDTFLTAFASVVAEGTGTGTECDGQRVLPSDALVSLGYNLEGDTDTCGFDGPGDQTGVTDLRMFGVQDNGGPTGTRLPRVNSPVVDVIPVGDCRPGPLPNSGADQRGVARPQGNLCDVGAVELDAAALPVPTTEPPPSTVPVSSGTPAPASGATPVAGDPRYTG